MSKASQEDWLHILRITWGNVSNVLHDVEDISNPAIQTALQHAVNALTDVATECVVARAKAEIAKCQTEIERQRNLLNAFGRQA